MGVKKGIALIFGVTAFCCASIEAQWPKHEESGIPRDAQGNVLMDAPAPRTADGRPDLSGVWMRANSAQPGGRGNQGQRGQGPRGQGRGEQAGGGAQGQSAEPGNTNAQFRGGRGGVVVEAPTQPFPVDPNGPPIATFFEAGGNMPGGLPYTPWAADLRKGRMDLNAKDNPDANCLPMGFLQFHQQPQPRKIIQTPKLILIEYESNYGIRHIYMDGRSLPPQGEPQPWWYGYSIGRWEGDTLVVETNNLRGAEDSPFDGWLDVNGSPYSQQAKFIERFRRPTFGHLQIDITVEDSKAYTKPFTVRVDQRILPDQEMIEFICNENQQFRNRVRID